jgi:hypothetical protein
MKIWESNNVNQLAHIVVIFGVVEFFLLTFLAAFLYPGGYDYFNYYFSDLGATIAKNGQANPYSSFLFFLALIIVSSTLVPFWVLSQQLFSELKTAKALGMLGMIFGISSSPFIFGMAFFPLDTQLEIHFTLVIIFFMLFSIAIFFYSLSILLSSNIQKQYGLVGLIALAIGIVLCMDPVGLFGAFLQKIVEYAYFGWVLVIINRSNWIQHSSRLEE